MLGKEFQRSARLIVSTSGGFIAPVNEKRSWKVLHFFMSFSGLESYIYLLELQKMSEFSWFVFY